MKRYRIEFDAVWDPRKVTVASNQVRAMIQSFWGASNISNIYEATEAAPKAPELLKLECRNRSFGKTCGAKWEAATFTDCPECGQRRFVHKAEREAEQAV